MNIVVCFVMVELGSLVFVIVVFVVVLYWIGFLIGSFGVCLCIRVVVVCILLMLVLDLDFLVEYESMVMCGLMLNWCVVLVEEIVMLVSCLLVGLGIIV